MGKVLSSGFSLLFYRSYRDNEVFYLEEKDSFEHLNSVNCEKKSEVSEMFGRKLSYGLFQEIHWQMIRIWAEIAAKEIVKREQNWDM